VQFRNSATQIMHSRITFAIKHFGHTLQSNQHVPQSNWPYFPVKSAIFPCQISWSYVSGSRRFADKPVCCLDFTWTRHFTDNDLLTRLLLADWWICWQDKSPTGHFADV